MGHQVTVHLGFPITSWVSLNLLRRPQPEAVAVGGAWPVQDQGAREPLARPPRPRAARRPSPSPLRWEDGVPRTQQEAEGTPARGLQADGVSPRTTLNVTAGCTAAAGRSGGGRADGAVFPRDRAVRGGPGPSLGVNGMAAGGGSIRGCPGDVQQPGLPVRGLGERAGRPEVARSRVRACPGARGNGSLMQRVLRCTPRPLRTRHRSQADSRPRPAGAAALPDRRPRPRPAPGTRTHEPRGRGDRTNRGYARAPLPSCRQQPVLRERQAPTWWRADYVLGPLQLRVASVLSGCGVCLFCPQTLSLCHHCP